MEKSTSIFKKFFPRKTNKSTTPTSNSNEERDSSKEITCQSSHSNVSEDQADVSGSQSSDGIAAATLPSTCSPSRAVPMSRPSELCRDAVEEADGEEEDEDENASEEAEGDDEAEEAAVDHCDNELIEFFQQYNLMDYLHYLPKMMKLEEFIKLSEQELIERYQMKEKVVDILTRAIFKLRELKATTRTERRQPRSSQERHHSEPDASSAPSPYPSSPVRRLTVHDQSDIPFLFNRHLRTIGMSRQLSSLSVDRDERRYSICGSSFRLPHRSSPSAMGSVSNLAALGHMPDNSLVRMRTSRLGLSAPCLSSVSRESSVASSACVSRKGSTKRKSSTHLPTSPPVLHTSLHHHHVSPVESPRGLSPGHASAFLPAKRAVDVRRWSFASAPSSGYGTTTPTNTGSTHSSLYSSQEKLLLHLNHAAHAAPSHLASSSHHVPTLSNEDSPAIGHSSNDSNPSFDDDGRCSPFQRPRSRSLTSPHKREASTEVALMNRVYQDRFPKATAQMEERLEAFIKEHEDFLSMSQMGDQSFRADGVAHFIQKQIVELAKDCLEKAKEKGISSAYFYELSESLEKLLIDAKERSPTNVVRMADMIKTLLIIVSRPARLLECLEFDPEEFYRLLEEAEGEAKMTIKTDIPKYIIGKLGLNKELFAGMTDIVQCDSGRPATPETDDSAERGSDAKQPSEQDFEIIKLISNGAYGAVYLVKHRVTKQRCAMKKISKQHLVLRNQVEQVFAERDIMTFTDNPFVVSFICSFETKKNLCLVMEYVEGGDCATLLKNMGPLPLDMARMYFAETTLAVEYLHSYGIVHRDLKPDNLLINSMGHIKLTDFGLSKIGIMSLTTNMYENRFEGKEFKDKQVFGTPEYIAPEVILRQGYGKPVDWWSSGIILYEFLVGCVPFFGETPEELFAHVINAEVEWPQDEEYSVPGDAKDLILRLLHQDPAYRLGTAGAQDVKEHVFFESIDWDNLLREKAEFVPSLQDDEDTSYFDTRSDRYHHGEVDDDDTDDTDSDLWSSFSSCSPRFSKVQQELELAIHHPSVQRKDSNLSTSSELSVSDVSSRKDSQSDVPETSDERSSQTVVEELDEQPAFSPEVSSASDVDPLAPLHRIRESEPQQSRRPSFGRKFMRHQRSRHERSNTDPKEIPANLISASSGPKTTPPADSVLPRLALPTETRPTAALRAMESRERSRSLRQPVLAPSQYLPPNPRFFKSVSATSLTLLIPQDERAAVPSPGASSLSSRDSSPGRDPSAPKQLQPPIVIPKGPRGFGFTLRAIRVYHGDSDVYTMQHLVMAVETSGPAFEAGLRPGHLITHVNDEPTEGLLHHEVVRLILSCAHKVSVRAVSLEQTSIRTGGRRRSPSKSRMATATGMRRRHPSDRRRKNSSLLRKLSTKRAGTYDLAAAGPSPLFVQGRKCSPLSPLGRSASSSESLSSELHPGRHSSPAGYEASTSSSNSSSAANSPALGFQRPNTLTVKAKLMPQSSPQRRKSIGHMPVSPLARASQRLSSPSERDAVQRTQSAEAGPLLKHVLCSNSKLRGEDTAEQGSSSNSSSGSGSAFNRDRWDEKKRVFESM